MKEIGNTRKNRGLLLLLAVCLLLSACGKGASSPAAAAETSAGMAREDMIYNGKAVWRRGVRTISLKQRSLPV